MVGNGLNPALPVWGTEGREFESPQPDYNRCSFIN